jgi:hypothetical protein
MDPKESHVIRNSNAPLLVGTTWEALAVNAAPHTGLDYESDRKTVHLFLLNNISEDSDAHVYILPHIRRNNGRIDWMTLSERYVNAAAIQGNINDANKIWDYLVYKNERAMSFEDFCKKMEKAIQAFIIAGRPKFEGDIIDWMWVHIQNDELKHHIVALKIGQSLQPRTYRQILQEIAKEVPNLSKRASFQPRVSEIHHTGSSDDFILEGTAPAEGCHIDGKLFCGTYSPKQWFSEEVKPHHSQIREIRRKHGNGKTRGNGNGNGGNSNGKSRRSQLAIQAKQRIKALEKSNEMLKMNLAAFQSTPSKEAEQQLVVYKKEDTKAKHLWQ